MAAYRLRQPSVGSSCQARRARPSWRKLRLSARATVRCGFFIERRTSRGFKERIFYTGPRQHKPKGWRISKDQTGG